MKSVPLFRLAETGKLPPHQFMDWETLYWIIENAPRFSRKKTKFPSREFLESFLPSHGWFLKRNGLDSLHGMRHLLRVAVNATLVARERSYRGDIRNLTIASVLHDVRRKDDKGDPAHGKRAAEWFRKNRILIEKRFRVRLDKKSADAIYWAIYFHELPIDEFSQKETYRHFKEEIDIVRAADALDRYRLPKTKWWINDKKLKMRIPLYLKNAAFGMTVRSEESFLNGAGSEESVLNFLP